MRARILAWHWVAADRKLRDGNTVAPGYIYSIPDDQEIVPCVWGLHASTCPLDALDWGPGPVICRVRIWGNMREHGDPVNKIAARHREVLWMADATDALRAFARSCALDVVGLWDAPDVVRRYLETGDESLRAAAGQPAAGAVSWSAARDAAGAAAWAAWDAAGAASRAAWDAARAAGKVAGAASRDAQRARLTAMLEDLQP